MSLITKRWGIICRIKKVFYKYYYKQCLDMHKSVSFRDGFKILLEKEALLTIGEGSFFNNDCSITGRNKISIGNNCLFGEGVKIYDHNHVFKNMPQLIVDQGFKVGEVVVGNNCWVGSNVVILKGAYIGDNCVIAAGSIVDFVVPSGVLVRRDGSMETIQNQRSCE